MVEEGIIDEEEEQNLMTELKLMKMESNGGKMRKANGGTVLLIKKIGMLMRSKFFNQINENNWL